MTQWGVEPAEHDKRQLTIHRRLQDKETFSFFLLANVGHPAASEYDHSGYDEK